jgi:membrane-associated protease RseP (regulator of RpoE activity)
MPENPSPPLEYQIFDPERQEIRVVLVPPSKKRYWLHALLFLTTLLSTLCIGARLQDDFDRTVWPYADYNYFLPWSWALEDWHRLAKGIPFAACLLGILTAHELGHYILCKRRGVQATLPFFIPFPSLIGTLGAVIRIKSPIRSRKDLFDIGIAGPIAGFVVAVPILFASLLASKPLTIPQGDGWPVLGFPLVFDLARWALSVLGSHSAAAHLSASHLYLAPTAVAAWVGMLATALNLLPGGQLDGGHIIFALNPHTHQWVSRLCILTLLLLSWFSWAGWLVWAILLRITGSRHPMVPAQPGLERKSQTLAVLAALMLLVTLTPAPTASSTLPQAIHDIQKQIRDSKQHR